MNGEINLRLTNRALVLVLGALALVWILFHATHIVVVLFIAVLLASAVSSAANRLERYRVNRSLTILILYLIVLGVLAGLIALLVPLITNEVTLLRDNLPQYQDQANSLLARLPHQGQPQRVNDLFKNLSGQLQSAALDLSRGVVEFGSALVTILLIFVIGYFMAADNQFAQRIVSRFFPPTTRPRAISIMNKIGDGLGFWVRAQLLLAFFFGFAFGVGLGIMRMPYALTLGVVGGVLEIIPYVGGFITIVLAVLIAATTGKLWLIIAAVCWYAVVVNVEAHFVAPKLVGEIVGLHPLVVVVALFLGAEVLGILGALLAVPIAVIIQTLLDEFWQFEDAPVTEETAHTDHRVTTLQPGLAAPQPSQPTGRQDD
ncbi:MAG TPA: AI-2E family transporter [Thermomicrobiales bacterium]|nr:AI-2E family transporter [Thermomicrobiales bacterium]